MQATYIRIRRIESYEWSISELPEITLACHAISASAELFVSDAERKSYETRGKGKKV